jgi:hypothetical protein
MAGTASDGLPSILLALALLLPSATAGAEQAASLYVSPAGNDAWSGSLAAPNTTKSDGPFATLTRARDEMRQRKAAGVLAGPVTVYLREGVYSLPETFKLDGHDSGTAEMPVTYRAYQAR